MDTILNGRQKKVEGQNETHNMQHQNHFPSHLQIDINLEPDSLSDCGWNGRATILCMQANWEGESKRRAHRYIRDLIAWPNIFWDVPLLLRILLNLCLPSIETVAKCDTHDTRELKLNSSDVTCLARMRKSRKCMINAKQFIRLEDNWNGIR